MVVVSGVLDVYLQPFCDTHQLQLLCSALEHRNGTLTGHYQGAQCVPEQKARRVRHHVDLRQYGCVYAYGDPAEDLPMLSLAQERYYLWKQHQD